MIMILHAVVAEQFLPYFFLFVGVVARFCGFVVDGIYAMGFFSSAVSTLKTVISAIGAGIGIWGIINLLESYGSGNPSEKNNGLKQLMAGGGIIIVAQTVIPLLMLNRYLKKRSFPNMPMLMIHRHMSLCVLTGMRNVRL
jgi:hypothetical protein